MPARSTLIDLARELKEDAKEAARGLRGLVGVEQNPHLRLYNKLAERDFRLMQEQFGEDATFDYIKTMELIRLRRSA